MMQPPLRAVLRTYGIRDVMDDDALSDEENSMRTVPIMVIMVRIDDDDDYDDDATQKSLANSCNVGD